MRSLPFSQVMARGIHAAITIELRDETIRINTSHKDIVLDGETFSARAAVNITQIKYSSDGFPSGADIRIAADASGPIIPGRATRGELDGLPVTVEIFDVNNLDVGGYDMIPGATVGSAMEDGNGIIVLAVQGKLIETRKPMAEIFTLTCKAKLGDDRCKIPLDVNYVQRSTAYYRTDRAGGISSPNQSWVRVVGPSYRNLVFECTTQGTTDPTTEPTFPTTPGLTVIDGSVVFTCRAARLVQATGQAFTFFEIQLTATPSPQPTLLGNIIPRTGPMAGVKIPISAFDSGTNIVTLFEPWSMTNFPPGTDFDIHRGCDKLLTTCRDDFGNLNNMRATPYAPASDTATGRA